MVDLKKDSVIYNWTLSPLAKRPEEQPEEEKPLR